MSSVREIENLKEAVSELEKKLAVAEATADGKEAKWKSSVRGRQELRGRIRSLKAKIGEAEKELSEHLNLFWDEYRAAFPE